MAGPARLLPWFPALVPSPLCSEFTCSGRHLHHGLVTLTHRMSSPPPTSCPTPTTWNTTGSGVCHLPRTGCPPARAWEVPDGVRPHAQGQLVASITSTPAGTSPPNQPSQHSQMSPHMHPWVQKTGRVRVRKHAIQVAPQASKVFRSLHPPLAHILGQMTLSDHISHLAACLSPPALGRRDGGSTSP